MQTLALKCGKDGLKDALAKAAAITPQLVLVFGAPSAWENRGAVSDACAPLQGVHVLGCSTAGEISPEGAADDSCTVVAMKFAHTAVKVAAAQLASPDMSRGAGKSVGEALKESGLRAIFALCPGTAVDGSGFVSGLAQAAGPGIVITGGLAGDGQNFKNTFTMLNGMVFPNLAVAFGLYGDKVAVKSATGSGWKPFGLLRRVTKSAGNILYEIDGKPAMSVFQRYLGNDVAAMPGSGLIYPFALMSEDGKDLGLARAVTGISSDGGLIMAGNIAQGSLLRLMYADPDLLAEGAAAAARDVAGSKGGAALLVSCGGRKKALGRDAGDELNAVAATLGSPVAGFYSYGHIGTTRSGGIDVHSQAITITHIVEEAA